jgi:hypothetical protein
MMGRGRSTVGLGGWLLAVWCQSAALVCCQSAVLICCQSAVLVCCQRVVAVDSQLSIELDPSSASLRTAAPLDLTWHVQWYGRSILEGHFNFEVRVGRHLAARCQTDDLVIAPGEQRIHVRLPSPGPEPLWTQPEIDLKLVTQDGTLDMGTTILVGRPGHRACSICVCLGDQDRTHPLEDELIKSLHIEELVADNFPVKLNTTATNWSRDDMPANPLGYSAFDIVVATREGFAMLRSRQLDALDRWVRAGGSLGVLVGAELPPSQLNFLNGLAGAEVNGPLFLGDGTVSPTTPREFAGGAWLSDWGLGRVAVINAEIDYESADSIELLRKIACHLWKVRRGKVDEIIANIDFDPFASKTDLTRGARSMQRQMAAANQRSGSGPQELAYCLMPRDVRVVPLGLIAAILLGYLVLIGPVDYLALGLLGMRRWTWLTFPLVTIATTLFCLVIFHSYLSSQKTGRSLTVRDLVAGGKIVRENRFQMVFTSTRREVTTSVHQGLFTAMDHNRLASMGQGYRVGGGISSMDVDLPRYRGSLPTDYDVVQTVPQWTPLLNRTLSIPRQDQADAFPWDRAKGLLATDAGRQELAQIVHDSLGPQATAIILNRQQQYKLSVGRVLSGVRILEDPRNPRQGEIIALTLDATLSQLSSRWELGLFSLISRISAHGGDSFEDLVLLDQSDPNQWLLLIQLNQEDDLVVLRRLYTGVIQ